MSAPVIIGNATLYLGDCLEILRTLPDSSVDSIVTDPPYGLGKEPDALAMLADWLATGHHDVKGSGFMGKAWDAFVPQPALWRECLRVLKPGGHLLAFAGTRTHDLMTMGLRIAGFEIRDTIMWVYGSGFPKSLDVSKAIDKAAGAERKVVGVKADPRYQYPRERSVFAVDRGGHETGTVGLGHGEDSPAAQITAPATPEAAKWQGWGTALKPALEPITLARKPLAGTVAANVLAHGTGALNIDGCRVATDPAVDDPRLGGAGTWNTGKMAKNVYEGGYSGEVVGSSPLGRWPANLIHDGSDEVLAGFPDTTSSKRNPATCGGKMNNAVYGDYGARTYGSTYGDSGSAARFFYCAKASRRDRGEGNNHPTVKPTDLMRYLCRLVTPPGGLVLDPFTGSGSTGKAAMLEGFRFIGCELDPDYAAIARRRIEAAQARGG